MNFLEFMVHQLFGIQCPTIFCDFGLFNSLAQAGGGGPYYMIFHYQKHTVLNYSLCKNRIEGVQGDDGGAFAAQETAKKLGCMRPPPVGWAKPPKTVGQPQPDAPDTSSKPWIS